MPLGNRQSRNDWGVTAGQDRSRTIPTAGTHHDIEERKPRRQIVRKFNCNRLQLHVMKIQHIITDADATIYVGDFRLAPEVIFAGLGDGTARLLDMSGSFFALSESAARLVESALRLPMKKASATVAAEFGADALEVERDLHDLVDELCRRGSLRPAAEPAKERGRRRWAGALLYPLLRAVLAAPVVSLGKHGCCCCWPFSPTAGVDGPRPSPHGERHRTANTRTLLRTRKSRR